MDHFLVNSLVATTGTDLTEMHLADAPDYMTAIAAGIAHGLPAKKALQSAYGKFLTDHKEAVEGLGLANVYSDTGAMVDQSRSIQFLTLLVVEQAATIAAITERLEAAEHKLGDRS